MKMIIEPKIVKDRRDLHDKLTADVLVIVDMQNDFLTGSLANDRADEVIKANVELIYKMANKASMKRPLYIILTQDTHDKDEYALTLEGQMLPIGHCFTGEPGWEINTTIMETCLLVDNYKCVNLVTVSKPTFGSLGLQQYLSELADTYFLNIVFTGLCSDICVVNNVLMARAALPNTPITVFSDTTNGTTYENTEAAFKVMQSCQVVVQCITE